MRSPERVTAPRRCQFSRQRRQRRRPNRETSHQTGERLLQLLPSFSLFSFSLGDTERVARDPSLSALRTKKRKRRTTKERKSSFFLRHSSPECLNECSDIRLPRSREKRGRSPVRPRTAKALLFFTICHTRADDELGRVMVGGGEKSETKKEEAIDGSDFAADQR